MRLQQVITKTPCLFAGVLFSLTAAINTAEAKPNTLALGKFGPRPTVDIAINGSKPFTVIVDTGFTGGLMLDKELVQALDLTYINTTQMQNMGKGKTMDINNYQGETIDFGDFTLELDNISSHDTSILAGEGMPKGVLSAWAFAPGTFTFDYTNNTLTHDSKQQLSTGQAGIVPLETGQHMFPSFDVNIDGQVFKGHLDTGSPSSITLPLALKDKFEYQKKPKVTGKARMPGRELAIWSGKLKGDVTIGQVRLNSPEVKFLDGIPGINIGSSFIKAHKISVDIENKLMQLH
ncbi:retropepsin-like aspartic protease [Thalassomonas actiniarum]|uniref:Aspartyl protease family protein n=1 Tax=Thalassomonas actiniarum TaxID=485447 RepID=A0AAF0C5R9_9GAMM|nr:retropepsin-like aspartic protease [Thalassomonas actiniarum]WDE01200.1 aspartyl protease family protein [Thalassomonas actiniarum]